MDWNTFLNPQPSAGLQKQLAENEAEYPMLQKLKEDPSFLMGMGSVKSVRAIPVGAFQDLSAAKKIFELKGASPKESAKTAVDWVSMEHSLPEAQAVTQPSTMSRLTRAELEARDIANAALTEKMLADEARNIGSGVTANPPLVPKMGKPQK